MFLKSITLTGFKSFAARTTLELDPGITVIVGPNGSGKSNIVDAVAWATGGQSTRGLRAGRTDELLFCGTAGLPPASRAEVTLVFDNTSGLLPIDRPEVAITRRHYRSGESRFEINRTPCRLMDITELLAEAGLRRSRYVLLGQGQVEQVLNASPAEHRRVLEEAAGVGKHLWRRDRAIRRLESARADLERIGDLIAEKRRRQRPLRRQAETLERYARLVAEVESLRLYLEGEKLREIDGRLRAAVGSRSEWEAVRSESAGRRERGLEELAALESAQEALRSESATHLLADWEMASERMRRIAAVAALRAEARRRRRQTERRRAVLLEERAALAEGLARTDGRLEAARAGVEEARREAARLAELEQSLAALRGAGDEAQIGEALGERAALRAAAERDRRERRAVEARMEELAAAAHRMESARERIALRVDTEARAVREEAGKVERAGRRAREARTALREAEAAASSAGTARAEASGRLEAARRALSAGDPERRRLMESLTGWAGWVSELLEVPGELASAVEAGLEGWARAAAFEGPVALGNALDRLGGATAGDGPVPMVSSRFPGAEDLPARTVAASGSRVTPLVDLLADSARRALAARLLGDVVLVEDWRAGWEVVGSHPHLRAVTRRGDLITVRGVILGGGERLPDLAAATAAAEESTARYDVARAEVERLRQEVDSTAQTRDRLGEAFHERRRGLREAGRDLERVSAGRAEIGRERDRLVDRLDALVEAETGRRARLAELGDRIAQLREDAAPADDPSGPARRLAEVSRARVEAEDRYRSETAALTGLAERGRLERARSEQLTLELAELTHLPEAPGGGSAAEVAELASSALQAMAARRESLAELDRAARRRSGRLASEAAEARKAIVRADRRARDATGEIERLIAEISRLDASRRSSVEALHEMGADPEQALGAPRPESGDPAAALAARAAELERIRPVNHHAAADLAVLDEELSELCAQHDDIVESDRRLGRVIAELEREATERYQATFRETARAFEQTFGRVFPGGRGSLRIIDPADPLGSGVEIRARPQGKRVSRLSLLSGGERALGALAFLFALMKTRPSPFYLLDEMDATLDAANLHRVLEVVRELRSEAQILIITHQPQTAEFAEALYGVTMPPGGATQVVSRRMDHARPGAGSRRTRARSA